MKAYCIAIAIILVTGSASAQELSRFEQAAQKFASEMPEALKDTIRQELLDSGQSLAQAERTISFSIENYTICALSALLDQAREQGLSEEIILDGFTNNLRSDADVSSFRKFDNETFIKRLTPCRQKLSMDLGLQIH